MIAKRRADASGKTPLFVARGRGNFSWFLGSICGRALQIV